LWSVFNQVKGFFCLSMNLTSSPLGSRLLGHPEVLSEMIWPLRRIAQNPSSSLDTIADVSYEGVINLDAFRQYILLALCPSSAAPLVARKIFQSREGPRLFRKDCLACHYSKEPRLGFWRRRDDSCPAGQRGGDCTGGAEKILPGEADRTAGESRQTLPREKAPKACSDAEIAVIRSWIDAGAPGRNRGNAVCDLDDREQFAAY